MNKLLRITLISAALMSTYAQADLDLKKVKSIFPKAEIVSTIELKPNYFEVQLIEKNSIIKKTHFYTNSSVDFIATKFVFTTPTQEKKYGITKPTFDYSNIKLSDYATFTYGEGEERNYFLTIPSDRSIKELKNIFKGNGYKNNVFLPFDTENYLELLYNLPIFKGTNEERINQAKITIDTIEKISSDLLNDKEAESILVSRLTEITKKSSTETLDEMAKLMQAAVEIKSIFAPDSDFSVLDIDKKLTSKTTKSLHQDIAVHEFSNDDLTNNWEDILNTSTAYQIGSGETKVFLFSDIDCPICVILDQNMTNFISPEFQVSVLYIPIQEIHPNSLDKTRYILSLPVSERWGMAAAIQGTDIDADLPREFIGTLSSEIITSIDAKISKSVSLSRILSVSGTPTAFKLVNTAAGKKLQVINPDSLFTPNLTQ